MNTFLLITYSIFLIGLGLIMAAIGLMLIWRLVADLLEGHQSYHYQRGCQAKEAELARGANLIWLTNYRQSEIQCAALRQENNQLRKAAYPGKC